MPNSRKTERTDTERRRWLLHKNCLTCANCLDFLCSRQWQFNLPLNLPQCYLCHYLRDTEKRCCCAGTGELCVLLEGFLYQALPLFSHITLLNQQSHKDPCRLIYVEELWVFLSYSGWNPSWPCALSCCGLRGQWIVNKRCGSNKLENIDHWTDTN